MEEREIGRDRERSGERGRERERERSGEREDVDKPTIKNEDKDRDEEPQQMKRMCSHTHPRRQSQGFTETVYRVTDTRESSWLSRFNSSNSPDRSSRSSAGRSEL